MKPILFIQSHQPKPMTEAVPYSSTLNSHFKKVINLFFVGAILFAAQLGCSSNHNSAAFLKKTVAAPAFTANDQKGNAVTLAELHKDGPVILTFLRSFF